MATREGMYIARLINYLKLYCHLLSIQNNSDYQNMLVVCIIYQNITFKKRIRFTQNKKKDFLRSVMIR